VLIGIVSIVLSTLVAHLVFQGLVAMPSLATSAGRTESIAHVLTIGLMAIFNYFAIKYIAFAKTRVFASRQCSSSI
jgi:hypothetical protein